MKQGGLTMDRIPTAGDSTARDTWPTWLRAAMTRHYGDNLKNNWLARDTDNVISEQTVSRWLKGEVAPTIQLARLAAITLEANLAEAYIAAGYGDIVEEVSRSIIGSALAQRETEADLRRELDTFQRTVNETINELRGLINGARTQPRDPRPDPGT